MHAYIPCGGFIVINTFLPNDTGMRLILTLTPTP